MVSIQENPNIDFNQLSNLESTIYSNEAIEDDYKLLDKNIAIIIGPQDYILNSMKRNGVNNYTDFIKERKKDVNYRNPSVDGILLGTIIGAIQTLKRLMTNNL